MKSRTAILLLPVALIVLAIIAPSINHTLVNACVAASIAWLYWLTDRKKEQADNLVDRLLTHNQNLVKRAYDLVMKAPERGVHAASPSDRHLINTGASARCMDHKHNLSNTGASARCMDPKNNISSSLSPASGEREELPRRS